MKGVFAAAALYSAVTVAMMLPLLRHIGSAYPSGLGGPVLDTWLSWGTKQPIVVYNVAFLVSFPLCGLAAYALGDELTGRRDAALLCGLAFAFAPYRMGQLAHLEVLSYYWAPIVLFGLHRYLRTHEVRWLVVFGGAWLLQSLASRDAFFHVSLFVALWLMWFGRDARLVVRILAAWAIAAVPAVPLLLTYRQVQISLHLAGDISEIKRYSAGVAGLLAPSPELALWGTRLFELHGEAGLFPGATMLLIGLASFVIWRVWQYGSHEVRTRDEHVLIALSAVAAAVGLSVYLVGPWAIGPLVVGDLRKPFSLAVLFRLLALLRGRWMRRAWRERSVAAFYLIVMIALYILALGPEPRFLGRPILYGAPYGWLMYVPGFDTLSAPARLASLIVLCEAVLLAFALARWLPQFARPHLAVALVAAGLVADGYVRVRVEAAPVQEPQRTAAVPAMIAVPTERRRTTFGRGSRGQSIGGEAGIPWWTAEWDVRATAGASLHP